MAAAALSACGGGGDDNSELTPTVNPTAQPTPTPNPTPTPDPNATPVPTAPPTPTPETTGTPVPTAEVSPTPTPEVTTTPTPTPTPTPTSTPSPSNVLSNSDLELGDETTFTDWDKWNTPAAMMPTTLEACSGRALEAVSPGGQYWDLQFVSANITTVTDATYTASMWIKSTVADSVVRFSTQSPNLETGGVNYQPDVSVGTDWMNVTYTFTAHDTVTRLVLDLGKTAATYYVDNIELTAGETATSTTCTGVSNPPEPTPDPGPRTFNFENDSDGMELDTGDATDPATVSLDATGDGYLTLDATWEPASGQVNQQATFRGLLPAEVDVEGGTLTIRYHVPAAYAQDGNLSFQPHAFDNDGTDEWKYTSLGSQAIDVDENGWGTMVFSSLPATTDANTKRIGLHVSANGMAEDVSGVITFDYFDLVLTDDTHLLPGETETLSVAGTDWTRDYGQDQPIISDDNGVVLTHDWTSGDAVVYTLLDSPTDLTGAQVTMVVDVPQSYVGNGLVLQQFAQQNAGSYTADFKGWFNSPVAGENTFTVTYDAPPADVQRIGIQLIDNEDALSSANISDPIVIRSVSIEFPPSL